MGADQAAERVGTSHLHGILTNVMRERHAEVVRPSRADARLHDRAQENLVHRNVAAVHKGWHAVDLLGLGRPLYALRHDGAGDVTRREAGGLHLLNEPPGAPLAAERM